MITVSSTQSFYLLSMEFTNQMTIDTLEFYMVDSGDILLELVTFDLDETFAPTVGDYYAVMNNLPSVNQSQPLAFKYFSSGFVTEPIAAVQVPKHSLIRYTQLKSFLNSPAMALDSITDIVYETTYGDLWDYGSSVAAIDEPNNIGYNRFHFRAYYSSSISSTVTVSLTDSYFSEGTYTLSVNGFNRAITISSFLQRK